MKNYVLGRYNAHEYEIEVDGEIVYRAGNSPLDSQGYVSKQDGIGIAEMKEYCIHTTKQEARERGIRYLGVEKLEED